MTNGGREHELGNVAPERHTAWLAGQMDELETRFEATVGKLTEEISATRKVLTMLLVAIIVGMITVPISLIWAAAIK